MLSSRRLEEDCPRPVVSVADLRWPDDPAEIPDWVYTDQRIFELEQERIFLGSTWNYVALEAELPRPGDYIRSYIGGIPIIVARDKAGAVHAFENRCAHRGVEFCKTYRGNNDQFVCPYHQWTYDLSGALISVPFRRGVKGKGGMPNDFRLDEHHLRALNVTCRHGVIFASRHEDMEPLEFIWVPKFSTSLTQFSTAESSRFLESIATRCQPTGSFTRRT